jgi:hypothetical protein
MLLLLLMMMMIFCHLQACEFFLDAFLSLASMWILSFFLSSAMLIMPEN